MSMVISSLLEKKSIFKIIRHSIFICLFLIVLQSITIFSIYDDNIKGFQTKIDTIVKTEGFDLNLICNVVSCKYAKYEDSNFILKNGILEETNDKINTLKVFYLFNSDYDTVVKYQDNTYFIINNDKFLRILFFILLISSIAIFGIFFVMSIIIYALEAKRNIMEKSILKNNLESRLQRDMTESLHHEMGTPLAVISTLIEEIYKMLYPCKHTSSKLCSFKTKNEYMSYCNSCIMFSGQNRNIDVIATKYYEKIMLSINSLNVIQNTIGESKHIKYSNGTVSLLEIITNVISSNNCYKVYKIEAEISNKDLLDKYACGVGLQNGEMLLVLNAMINNSIEAKANKMFVSAVLSKSEDIMEILIQDNGRGIRDRDGHIVNDINIFNYGYSTKTRDGETLKPKNKIEKFMDKLFDVNNIDVANERGVGLSVNKRILNKSSGDITLISTDEHGTLFKITIPIKVRRKK